MIISIKLKASEIENEIPYREFEYFMAKLIQTSVDGAHFISIEKSLSDWIIEYLGLAGLYKEHLMMLGEDHIFQKQLMEDAGVILNVVCQGELTLNADDKNWCIGYGSLLDRKYLDRTAVVVENIKYDGGFFALVFKELEDKFKMIHRNAICFAYTFYHGGGSDTADLLEYLVNDQRIIVCICDSDQIIPGQYADNSTYKKAVKMKAELETKGLKGRSNDQENICKLFVGEMFATPGNELENMFFLEMAHEVCAACDKSFNDKMDDYKKLVNIANNNKVYNNNYEIYLFYDMKNGVNIKKIIESCKINISIDKEVDVDCYDSMYYLDKYKNILKIELRQKFDSEFVEVYTSEDYNKLQNSSIENNELTKIPVKIDKEKFDWFLKCYNLNLGDAHNFCIEFKYKEIVGDFLRISDQLKQNEVLTKHMESEYWVANFEDWFLSICWYFCSREKQTN